MEPSIVSLLLLFSLGASSSGYNLPTTRHVEEQPRHHLQQDILDFLNLIPFDDVQSLMQYYYHYDAQVESALDYVSSEDYTQIKLEIMNLSEVRSFRRYLDGIGFSVVHVWRELTKRFDVEEIFAEPDEAMRSCEFALGGHPPQTTWTLSAVHGNLSDFQNIFTQAQTC